MRIIKGAIDSVRCNLCRLEERGDVVCSRLARPQRRRSGHCGGRAPRTRQVLPLAGRHRRSPRGERVVRCLLTVDCVAAQCTDSLLCALCVEHALCVGVCRMSARRTRTEMSPRWWMSGSAVVFESGGTKEKLEQAAHVVLEAFSHCAVKVSARSASFSPSNWRIWTGGPTGSLLTNDHHGAEPPGTELFFRYTVVFGEKLPFSTPLYVMARHSGINEHDARACSFLATRMTLMSFPAPMKPA
eukprot:6189911-Pleurochrysis_carterae.AAC.2